MLELSGQNYNPTGSLFVPQQHLAEVQKYISGDVFPEEVGKPFTTAPVAIGAEDVGWDTLTPEERLQVIGMEGVSPEQAQRRFWMPKQQYQRVSFRHQFKVNNAGGRPSNPAAATRTIILPVNGSMAFSPENHVLDLTENGPVLHAPRQATDADMDATAADEMNAAAERAVGRGVPDVRPNPARTQEGPNQDGSTRRGPAGNDGSEPDPIDIEAGIREELGPEDVKPAVSQPTTAAPGSRLRRVVGAARQKVADAAGATVDVVKRNPRKALGLAALATAGGASYLGSSPEEATASPMGPIYPPDAGGDGADINSGRPDVLARIRGSRPVGIMTSQYGIPY